MKFVFSITQLPELSELTEQQRRMVLLDFSVYENRTERARQGFRFREVALTGVIVIAELAGILGGCLFSRMPFWGPVCGGLIALCAVAVPAYVFGTQSVARRLRRYLQSEEGQLMFAFIKITTPNNSTPPNGGSATQIGNSGVTERPPSRSRIVMSPQSDKSPVNLNLDDLASVQPVPRFVNLILLHAIWDDAEKIEFLLLNATSETGLRMSYTIKGTKVDMTPAPGSLFRPAVDVLCNYASIAYYAKSPSRGEIRTMRPDSHWLLESDDLENHVLLSKT